MKMNQMSFLVCCIIAASSFAQVSNDEALHRLQERKHLHEIAATQPVDHRSYDLVVTENLQLKRQIASLQKEVDRLTQMLAKAPTDVLPMQRTEPYVGQSGSEYLQGWKNSDNPLSVELVSDNEKSTLYRNTLTGWYFSINKATGKIDKVTRMERVGSGSVTLPSTVHP